MMTAPRTPGAGVRKPPREMLWGGGEDIASIVADVNRRKPREVWRSCASEAMGISALAVCCRRALTGSLGSGRRGGELGRPIATGRTGVAQPRLIDKSVVQGGATA